MQIYQRMRDLREDKDMKQSEVAEVLNMKQQQYRVCSHKGVDKQIKIW